MKKLLNYPFFIRLGNSEYWPAFFYYFPISLKYIWNVLRTGNPFYLLATNPGFHEGLMLNNSKIKTFSNIPDKYKPKMILVKVKEETPIVIERMKEKGINFPVILKPNIGYRGIKIHKILTERELTDVLKVMRIDYLMQEYVEYPEEYGVFYYRIPGQEKGRIESLTLKEFLIVKGDGTKTLSQLVDELPRAKLQEDHLAKKFSSSWDTIIENGKEIVLEEIGNHNKGAKFTNVNAQIDDRLLSVFDGLNKHMEGFNFGRFDIRAKSLEDLKNGRDFKILEVNGIGAEALHVYDPSYNLYKAWKDWMGLWSVMHNISIINHENGTQFIPISIGFKRVKEFLSYSRMLRKPL